MLIGTFCCAFVDLAYRFHYTESKHQIESQVKVIPLKYLFDFPISQIDSPLIQLHLLQHQADRFRFRTQTNKIMINVDSKFWRCLHSIKFHRALCTLSGGEKLSDEAN